MIYLYTGKTGSGKTFQMIKDVYPRWKRGEDIYSNTKLYYEDKIHKANTSIIDNPDCFTRYDHIRWLIKFNIVKLLYTITRLKIFLYVEPPIRGNIIYFDDITELIEIQDGVIVLDEAQNLLDARNWENLPLEIANKLRQHRKHSLDLYGTTQNMGTIDINLRRLVQGWIHCKDIFALFGIRNPSLLTIHQKQTKDIDQLYNNIDDLKADTIKSKIFFIHKLKIKLYDTLFDVGFKAYKIIWTERKKKKICLIIPRHWTLNNARQQLLLQKFFLDQTR